MADTNLGRVGFVPKGLHNSGAPYDILDTVVYAKNGYCCIKPVPIDSGILPTNTEYFQLLVEKGDPGIQGPGGTGPKGDSFTYADFTTEQLEDITSGIAAFKTIIRGQETKIGTIRLFNLDYDLYRMIVEIPTIPTTLNEETTYTLATIPLGFNLYLKTDSLVAAQEAGAATTDFYNDSYKISRLFVDSDLCTKVTIKCIQAVTTTVKATIQVEYVKDFGDVLELNVTVPAGINPADVNLTFPKLKYNKKNVATFLIEDSTSCWNLFSAMNKKWVDNEKLSFFIPGDSRSFFFHKGFTYVMGSTTYYKSAGLYPAKAYEYTDGAGVKHRYAFTIDSWPWTIEQSANGWAWSLVNADEISVMQDFGVSTIIHDIEGVIDLTDEEQALITQAEFEEYAEIEQNKLKARIGRFSKGGSTAAGKVVYLKHLDYAKTNFLLSSAAPAGAVFYKPFADGSSPDKSVNRLRGKAWVGEYNLVTFKSDILTNAAGDLADREFNFLFIDKVYTIDSDYLGFLSDIDAVIGESGNDSLLFASVDEVYEYWFMTKFGRAYKSIDGQKITFKIHAPCNHNFYFKSLSCLLSGISALTDITVTSSDNCNGTSFGLSENQLLVNLDFNTDLLSKVEKYLTIFEAHPAQEYAYDDALYFIQQLKPGVKESYEARLNAFVSAPTLTAVLINAGAATTSSNSVTVALSIVGSASQMMLSEDVNFSGASWVAFAASSTFVLSAGFTAKTIYIQLRNAFGDSSVLSDSISFIDTPLVLSAIVINAGASITNTDVVSLAFTYTGAPTQMMLSESPDFTGASWVAFSGTPSFTLSAGYAVKTLYAKLQNATTISSVVSDSIEYAFVEAVSLSSIVINSGAESTDNTVISVLLSYTGSPTQYRISESATFVGASWITLSGATVSFAMSAALGAKTIYAQVQNTGGVSAVRSDSITLLAGAVKAVVSFAGATGNGVMVYDTANDVGITVNVMQVIAVAGQAHKPLKSSTGADLAGWNLVADRTYYPAITDVALEGCALSSSSVALVTQSGPYPIKYLLKPELMPMTGGTNLRGRIVFTLPVGTYTFKMIMSVNSAQALASTEQPYCWYKVVANGVSTNDVLVGATGFTGLLNTDFNSELSFTVTEAATANVVFFVWHNRPTNMGFRPAVNLIEISKTA